MIFFDSKKEKAVYETKSFLRLEWYKRKKCFSILSEILIDELIASFAVDIPTNPGFISAIN